MSLKRAEKYLDSPIRIAGFYKKDKKGSFLLEKVVKVGNVFNHQ